jgi:hypothetical protein
MSLISIQETAISDGHYHAKLLFDRGATYPITVTNPFSEAVCVVCVGCAKRPFVLHTNLSGVQR